MLSTRFDNANLTTISPPQLSPTLEMSSYAAPFMQGHAIEAGNMSSEAEWASEEVTDGRSLVRGVGWALTIESGAALCLYAIWHLWHLWR